MILTKVLGFFVCLFVLNGAHLSCHSWGYRDILGRPYFNRAKHQLGHLGYICSQILC